MSTGCMAAATGSADKVGIRQGGDGPVIDGSTGAVANVMVVDDWGHTDSVEIPSGSLTTADWIILGYGDGDDGDYWY